jgi:hypothetical protein
MSNLIHVTGAQYDPAGFVTLTWTRLKLDGNCGFAVYLNYMIVGSSGQQIYFLRDPAAVSAVFPWDFQGTTLVMYGLDSSGNRNQAVRSDVVPVSY